jgi:hypothetical protein
MSGLPETGHAAATLKSTRIWIGRHIDARHSRAPIFAFSHAARNFAFASSSVAAVPYPAGDAGTISGYPP